MRVRESRAMTEPLTGRCLCGGVRFVLQAPPTFAGYCHCTRCQRRTGTASSLGVGVDGDALDVVEGAQLVSWWRHPDGGFEKGFCQQCGGHLFSRDPDDHALAGIRMAAFDGDPGVRPSYRQFVAYAASWEPIPDDGLPRYPERRPPA
jgi:hypothetical protein